MNTTDKLAEALTLGLECAYELLAEKRQALAGHPEKVAPYQEMADYLRRELAAHEQAQADDWQHLKPYGYAPGNYMSRCRTCGDTPVMDKRAITCRPCAEAKFAASQAQAERVGLTDEQIEPKAHAGEPVVPYLYVYEYDSPFGLNREFYPSGWNGQKPTRTVPLYTTPQPALAQRREPLTASQVNELCNECHLDWHRGWSLDEEPNRYLELARAIEKHHGIGATPGEQR